MSRIEYIFIVATVFFGNQNNVYSQNIVSNETAETIDTKQDTLFDVYRCQRKNSKGENKTYERKVPKERIIFKKGEIYHYKAIYIDSNNDTLSNSLINMKTTGERWEGQPESQDLIYYEFPGYKADSIKLNNHKINKEFQIWTDNSTTGVTENIEQVWMHPIRANQYKFTEVAPFPEVYFPLQKGKKWEGEIIVFEGWGEWSGQRVKSKYKIAGRASYLFENIEINCWVIKSVAKCPSGKSKLITLFNEEFGFVKMEYQNYIKEKLIFELISVEGKKIMNKL